MKQTQLLIWLWTRFLVAIFLLVCFLATSLLVFVGAGPVIKTGVMQPESQTLLWLAVACLILGAFVGIFIFPWVIKKHEQSKAETGI